MKACEIFVLGPTGTVLVLFRCLYPSIAISISFEHTVVMCTWLICRSQSRFSAFHYNADDLITVWRVRAVWRRCAHRRCKSPRRSSRYSHGALRRVVSAAASWRKSSWTSTSRPRARRSLATWNRACPSSLLTAERTTRNRVMVMRTPGNTGFRPRQPFSPCNSS